MTHILDVFTRWRESSGGSVAAFADWFINFRYSMPGFDSGEAELQRDVARAALPFYTKALSRGGEVSLLALLGAISEAERFVVDPQLVFTSTNDRMDSKLRTAVVGDAGITDLPNAMRGAGERFQQEVLSVRN